jgi:hypothetical protein
MSASDSKSLENRHDKVADYLKTHIEQLNRQYDVIRQEITGAVKNHVDLGNL